MISFISINPYRNTIPILVSEWYIVHKINTTHFKPIKLAWLFFWLKTQVFANPRPVVEGIYMLDLTYTAITNI